MMTRYAGIAGVLFVFALLAYALIHWLAKPETLPIERIELLTTLTQQDAGQLQTVASKAINGGFFNLDLEHFRQKIENLAWVESVSIRKKWPDTIQLSIYERTAVARWVSVDGSEKKSLQKHELWENKELLSDKGTIFQAPLSTQQLAHFSRFELYMGPANLAGEVLENCQMIAKKLEKAALQQKTCGLDQRRAWHLRLENDLNLRLGREALKGISQQRINDFIKVYQSALHKYITRIARVDMRYTNGFSVTWKGITRSDITQEQSDQE